MKAIIEMLGSMNFRGMRKRAIASALALLMIVSMVPAVWLAANAADSDYACGLEEHAHSAECYAAEASCGIPEGEQYEIHAHTDDCTSAEPPCELEEGASVLVGNHTHSAECYALVCEKTEHAHTEACEAPAEKSGENSEDALAPIEENAEDDVMLLAGTTDLSVSGIWDVGDSSKGHENIPFGSSEQATVSHDANQASEQVNVRITASFPEDANNLTLKINLKPGLQWLVNGANTIPKTTLESVSALQNETTYVKALGDGTYTYKFKDGVTSVTVDIVVEKCFWTNFPSISDAITAEVSCTQNGETVSESASLTTLLPQQFDHIVLRRNISVRTKAEETVSVRNGLRIGSYLTSAAEKDRSRLYEYIEFTINAPAEVEYLGIHSDDTSEGSPNKKWQMVGEPEVLDNGTVNYTFRGEDIFSMYFSSTHYWSFPESMIGQDVKIITTDFRWKIYGDTVERSVADGVVGTATVTVVDPDARDEKMEISGCDLSLTLAYDSDAPDATYRLSAWSIRNSGTDPTEPKIVELDFDTEKIGVQGVTLLTSYRQKLTTVWFKTEGSDEWQQKTVSIPVFHSSGAGYCYHTLVRNTDLGLSEDTYISAIKYELDYLDNNGTADDTSDDFRFGLRAGEASLSYGSVYAPIIGVVKEAFHADTSNVITTARIYDKVEEGEEIINDTGKVNIVTQYNKTMQNFLSVVNNDVIEAEAGDTLTFSTDIVSYWSSLTGKEYIAGFHPYPVIYIRDETGEGISNVKLTNAFGTELLSKYPNAVKLTLDHTETVDHNGDGKFAKVYKIDTTGLKSMADFEDRYAACIGCCDLSGNTREMNLTYSVVTSSTYNDSQTVHYTADAVFLTDRDMANRTQRNKRNEISDEFDVDSDGLTTTDKSIVAPSTSYSPGYYIIAARSDVSVSADVKKSSDASAPYTSWDGSASGYLQVMPGETYNVRNSVLNGSGVKTSEEEAKMTYIFIPIPKEGQQWGQANSGVDKDGNALSAFAYDMVLSGAVSNPNPDIFTISYGTVNTSAFSAGDSYGTVGQILKNGTTAWSSSYSDSTNCVRIAVKGMPPADAAERFILPLKADEDADNRAVNIFSSIYYEDITNINGNHFAGWYSSDRLALQIAEGEISGRIWIDANGNGLQDEGEKGLANTAVTLAGDENYSAATDTNGKYSFAKLPLGEYTVSFAPDLDAYALAEKNAGSDSLDSDAVLNGTKAEITGIVIPSTDSMGKQTFTIANLDAGLVPYVNVDYSWDGDIPNGSVLPESDKLAAGTEYTAETVDTVTGYTFDGWYTDEALSESFADNTVITEDTILYGKWTVKKYDVTYAWGEVKPSAAVLPEKDTVPYGTAYNAKTPAAVTGYIFDGWYTDEACTTAYTDGTAVTDDVTIYGKWTRSTVDVEGSVNWVENGEGFTRPDTVTVNLMRDGTKIDSVEVTVDDKTSQSFTFTDLPEYSEDGTVKYEYTVAQETVPTNYVETVSGYEVVNTYNVNKYYITVEWDHTGAPAAEKVTEATVILNRDGEGYKTATLTEATPTATTTIARPEAAGHTFSIEQNAIPGYETTYSEPVGVDTDNDGEVDAVTYTVKNTYIMPKTSVSGDIEWVDVPDGETVPDITVNLMLNGEVVDTVEIPAGNPTYQFTNLDRYNADGTPAEYTVEVEAIPSYSTAYSDAETDEDGNRTINITNTGEFEYGSLTVKNTVVGGDDEFTFTVTVGKKTEAPQAVTYAIRRAAAVQYPYSGTYSGTITAGEPTEFTLKNGEYITIENMLVGVNYTVVQKAHSDYYTTPASLTASGVISADETVETFVNSKIPTGTLSITTKVTGSGADKNTVFEYKVTIDSEDSFQYTIGETTGTLKSGDVLRLKHGETAVIVGIKEGTSYTVTQVADQGYKMTSTGTSGKVTAQGITASFINTKEASGGSNVPDTGDYSSGTGEVIAIYVMQTAMLMMLFCAWQMKRRKENEEA